MYGININNTLDIIALIIKSNFLIIKFAYKRGNINFFL